MLGSCYLTLGGKRSTLNTRVLQQNVVLSYARKVLKMRSIQAERNTFQNSQALLTWDSEKTPGCRRVAGAKVTR